MLHIASYAYGHAAQNPGCADGPQVIKKSTFLDDCAAELQWESIFTSDNQQQGQQALASVMDINARLADWAAKKVKQKQRFLTLGGDHSAAIGTWSGVASALGSSSALGLIWFDAHMDSHTFSTTPSNNIHGMPLAVLLGHGDKSLTDLQSLSPKCMPYNTCVMGVRSYENEEAALLQHLGVHILTMSQINDMGFATAFETAVNIVSQRSSAIGISIDLDGIDPEDAPGVGSPVRKGVSGEALLNALPLLMRQENFIGAEIVEFNPYLDRGQKTERLTCELIRLFSQ